MLESEPNVIHGFSSLEDGNMSFLWGEEEEVLKHREDFLWKLGVDSKKCAVMSVCDENVIEEVTHDTAMGVEKEEKIKADALITKEKDIALFLLTADCLPIILYDPVVKAIALVHAGWKSTDARLSVHIVKMLKEKYGSNPRDVVVGIGPGIHKESYAFATSTREYTKEWESFLEHLPSGGIAIDLVGYNKKQLLGVGIPESNIEVSDVDTGKDRRFFSHHRAEKTGGKEGRFATVVMMR